LRGLVGGEGRGTMDRLAESALDRLRNLDMPASEIERLRQGGEVRRLVPLLSLFQGVAIEKTALAGARFMPGEPLYRIADTQSMWLIAEGRDFAGRVTFIYPTVGRETRTARIRLELPNRDAALKADMYAEVTIATGADRPVLAVPESAVIDDGSRQYVLVAKGEGRFEPRAVKLGAKSVGYHEVREGLAPGERVVVDATFLIDAESNLRAALKAFTPAEKAQ